MFKFSGLTSVGATVTASVGFDVGEGGMVTVGVGVVGEGVTVGVNILVGVTVIVAVAVVI
jgi:hypothetical protein